MKSYRLLTCAMAVGTIAVTVLPQIANAYPEWHNWHNSGVNYTNQAYFGYSGATLDARENRLNIAIQRAVGQGRITGREASRLLSEQARLNQLEGRMRMQDGGRLTSMEKVRLSADIDRMTAQLRFDLSKNRIPW